MVGQGARKAIRHLGRHVNCCPRTLQSGHCRTAIAGWALVADGLGWCYRNRNYEKAGWSRLFSPAKQNRRRKAPVLFQVAV